MAEHSTVGEREGRKRNRRVLYCNNNKVLFYKELLYIPKEETLRDQILQENHDHPLARHLGTRRTKDLILAKYYWPTI